MTTNTKVIWDNPKYAKASGSVATVTEVYGKKMLEQAGVPQSSENAPLVVLDLACGTGVVTAALQDMMKSKPQNSFEVTCGDLADAMLDSARERVKSQGWTNTTVTKVDAQNTKLPSNHFTHIFTNFGPMLFPKPEDMLSECNRMLKPGGICAFTTWSAVGWYNDLNTAMQSMPEYPKLPPFKDAQSAFGNGGAWNEPEYIQNQLETHRFSNIVINRVPNISLAQNVQELKAVLDMIIGLVVAKFWTQEERDRLEVSILDDKIREWFEGKYGDGPIEWHWEGLVTTSVKQ